MDTAHLICASPSFTAQVNWDTALANIEVTFGGPQAGNCLLFCSIYIIYIYLLYRTMEYVENSLHLSTFMKISKLNQGQCRIFFCDF